MEAKKIILYVDDDQDDQDIISDIVKDIDPTIKFLSANNGLTAYNLLLQLEKNQKLPCLIMMDINMPVMGGKEAFAEIKKQKMFEDIQIVMFSTSMHPLDIEFCRHNNLQLISKPGTLGMTRNKIKKLLDNCL